MEESKEIRTISELEQEEILKALDWFHGCREYAAKAVGISIRTLRNKLQSYRAKGILVPQSNWRAHGRAKVLKDERPVASLYVPVRKPRLGGR